MALFDFVQTKTANGFPDSVVATFDSTVTSGNLILVLARCNNDATGRIVTDTYGNTYFKVDATSYFLGELWAAYNVTGGATFAVTFTHTGGTDLNSATIFIHEYVGSSAVAFDASTNWAGLSTGSAAYDSGNLTTTVTGDLLFGQLAVRNGDWFGEVATGYTIRTLVAIGGFVSSEGTQDKVAGAAGSYNMAGSIHGSADDIWSNLIAFKGGTPAAIPFIYMPIAPSYIYRPSKMIAY